MMKACLESMLFFLSTAILIYFIFFFLSFQHEALFERCQKDCNITYVNDTKYKYFISTNRCPPGYSYHIIYKLNKKYCYRIIKASIHSGLAKQECALASRGYLTIYDAIEELKMINSILELSGKACSDVWINGYVREGLRYPDVKVTKYGREKNIKLSNWASGQPGNNKTLCIVAMKEHSWRWVSEACDYQADCYMCETDFRVKRTPFNFTGG